MTFPTLGLVAPVARSEAAAPLLRALSDRCRLVAWHPGLPVDAVFATSWRAPGLRAATREAAGRLVIWHDPADPAPAEWIARAAASVSSPDPGVDVRTYRPVAPFLRQRWRGRFAIDVPVTMPADLAWRQRRSFLALCPAVVASGTTALEALAFATPVVTDGATAAGLGAVDGVHVVVCDAGMAEAIEVAEALGADHRRGAGVGHAGRRLVEEHHDLSRPAAEVALALGWAPRVSRVAAHLHDLPTPPLSRPVTRAEARIAELSLAGSRR